MKYPYNIASQKAKIKDTFTGYEVMWICKKGHKNFQTVIGDETRPQHDICLGCGQHYEYEVDLPIPKEGETK